MREKYIDNGKRWGEKREKKEYIKKGGGNMIGKKNRIKNVPAVQKNIY